MKKILSILGTVILSFTIVQNTKQFLTNHAVFTKTNLVSNNLNAQSDIRWKSLEKDGFFVKMNDNLGVFNERIVGEPLNWNSYLLNDSGQFTILSKKGIFLRLNNFLGLINISDENGHYIETDFLDSTGKFTKIDKKIRDFYFFSENTALIIEEKTNKLFFLDSTGKFTDIGQSTWSGGFDFSKFNDNLAIISWQRNSYFLNKSGNCTKLTFWVTNLTFSKFNDNLAVFTEFNTNNTYFLDSTGKTTKINLGIEVIGSIKYFNKNLVILMTNNGATYFLDSTGKIVSLNKNGFDINRFFVKMNDNLGIFNAIDSDGNNTYFLDSTGKFTKIDKLGKFTEFNQHFGIFETINGKEFFLYQLVNPADLEKLKNDIKFDLTQPNQNIIDINNTQYKGQVTNNEINLNINNTHVLEVTIDSILQPLTSGKVQALISDEGSHEIIIKNDLTDDLIYNLYIKKQATETDIDNTTHEQTLKYVGVDNKNNLIDILQSPSEIQFSFSDLFYKSNVINTLDNNFNIVDSKDILQNERFSSKGNYMILTEDLVGNISQKYLTIGTVNIKNYFDTVQGKLVETEALKHKYTDEVLRNLNSKAVQHVIEQYNSRIWDQKLSLNDIKSLSLKNNMPDKNKTYEDLSQSILNAPEFNGLMLTNPDIQFLDMNDQAITNDNEKPGQFKIKIEANTSDIHWEGTLETTLTLKLNLNNIKSLKLDDLIADKTKTYNDLKQSILNAPEFKSLSLKRPSIQFFDMNGNNIINHTEITGKFQIIITANISDSNWTGSTQKITLDLGSNWIPIVPGTDVPSPNSNSSIIWLLLGIGLPVILIVTITAGAMFYRKRSSKIKIKHDK